MPVIIFEGGKLSKSQKAELAKSFTEISSQVVQIRPEAFIVLFHENDPDSVGVGGQLLSK